MLDVVDVLLAAAPTLASRPRAELASSLAAMLAAAHAAWPQIAVPDREFVAHVGRHVDPELGLGAIRAADLYLAFACGRRDEAAMAAFEALTFREIDIAGATARATPDLIAETRSHLRQLLFVGAEGHPATLEFAGRGDLRGWVRVSALRHLLRVQGKAKRELSLDDEGLIDALAPDDDPELGYIKDMYRGAFATAFRDAIAALDQRQKSLLRYQLVDGLTIDDVGALHGVHRATAARWVAAARDALADHTRRLLGEQLGIPTADVESVIRLVSSRIDVSLERLLT